MIDWLVVNLQRRFARTRADSSRLRCTLETWRNEWRSWNRADRV